MQTLVALSDQAPTTATSGFLGWLTAVASIVAPVTGAALAASRLSAPARYQAAAHRCTTLASKLPKDSPARASLIATAEWYGARVAARRMVYSGNGTIAVGSVCLAVGFSGLLWLVFHVPVDTLGPGYLSAFLSAACISVVAMFALAIKASADRGAVTAAVLAGDASLLEWVGPSGFLDARKLRDLRRSLRSSARAGGRARLMRRWFSRWGRR